MDKIHPDQLLAPYIRTHTNRKVEFLNPKEDQICIKEIAWHLARTCRYNALLEVWYSNAEHSILGSRKAKSLPVARAFLLHDAAEYVFSDMPSPVKRLCPEYKKLIDNFQDCLYRHYNVCPHAVTMIEEIDHRMTATEMHVLRGQLDNDRCVPAYDDLNFYCWEWRDAYNAFINEFKLLFPEVKVV